MTPTPNDGDATSLLMPGTEVEVVIRFSGEWAAGFEIAGVDQGRYHLRRRSDRAVLPATFAPRHVRPTWRPAARG
jgi:hypothetical protein